MTKPPFKMPITLPVIAIVLLAAGILVGPIIQARATPQQLADNVLLGALPFILIFVAIILGFITLIVIAARLLNHSIAASTHRTIETVIIAGIALGIVGMFQPWVFALYRFGFLLLLVSTLCFILWSHVIPRRARSEEVNNH